jgi:hypothetical protein
VTVTARAPQPPQLRPAGRGPRAALLLLAVCAACSGQIGEASSGLSPGLEGALGGLANDRNAPGSDGGSAGPGDGAGDGSGPAGFRCDPDAEPAGVRWRRLTRLQYDATLRDLLAWALGDAGDAQSVLDAALPELGLLPADVRKVSSEDLHGSYRALDQDVSDAHVEGWYQVGLAVGKQLAAPARLGTLLGACATDTDASNDDACIDGFIARFGARALRRPLDADERAFYRSVYAATGIDPLGVADLVAVLLGAPQFLYLVEHGASAASGARIALGAHELAARLSYHFWGTLPDAALWSAAEDGSLLEPTVYEAAVDRLIADPRARATTREFYRDWLKLEDLPELDRLNDSPLFQAFAGTPLPSAGLREQMIDEVLDLLQYYTWDEPSDLDAVLLSELSFARDAELAAIYGVEPWSGSEAGVQLPAERTGLLSRAAFLATGSPNTRPVMKGLFIRRYVLCDTIPPPPNNAAANTPELSDDLSTRQVVEELTEQPGSVCAGCHVTQINPMGFATENFDSLGRLRSEQTLFSADGSVTGSVAVDTTSVPQVVPGDATAVSDATGLMRLIVDSGKAPACLARQYFRFSYGRFEDPVSDGCALAQLHGALVDGGNLADMLREVALTPEFQSRAVE